MCSNTKFSMIILSHVGPVCPHRHRRHRKRLHSNYNNGQLDRQKREAVGGSEGVAVRGESAFVYLL